MSVSLEQIAAALFAVGQTVPGLVTSSRDLRAWSDLQPSEQPALFQASEDSDAPAPPMSAGGRSIAVPMPWTLRFSWYLYQRKENAAGAGVALDTAINTLVDACKAALAPGTGQMNQTLGGLVADCRIAGTIARDGGALGDQGVAIVPIEVLAFR